MVRLLAGRSPPQPPLADIVSAATSLTRCSDAQLLETSLALRNHPGSWDAADPARDIQAFAVVCEAVRRTMRIQLYEVQLRAAWVLAQGRVAEMQTGEGKTLACAPAAYAHALAGRGVHVATPNAYLAQRDHELLAPAFRRLGVVVGLLPERGAAAAKRAAYQCDITYGAGYEFGFDYLRDQLALRQAAACELGEQLWLQLRGDEPRLPAPVQRPLYSAIVDEVDNVLLDDARSPLVLSGPADTEACDEAAHQAARRLAEWLLPGQHYDFQPSAGLVRLTKAGVERVHATEVAIPVAALRRTWTEYVEAALAARLLFRRDVHYVVRDQAVHLVDASTGRIFAERVWQDGLHQAMEAKEGLRITAEKLALAQITRQRYFRLYPRLSGMTGTAAGCEAEFTQVYGLRVQPIPLRRTSQLTVLPARFFATAAAKWRAVAESVTQMCLAGRPVLVGTRNIDDSERLAEILRQQGRTLQLLNGVQDAAEATVVARAGQRGAVTIATNLAGRGTDIRLTPETAQRGGLHIVVGECHDSQRVDRQLVGRAARQGDPGSAQTFVSAGDSLLQQHGPWLAAYLHRHAGPDGEVRLDLMAHVRRLQVVAQRMDYAARCSLLRRDRSRDVLFSQHRQPS